jgi:chromosome segregation ATPase
MAPSPYVYAVPGGVMMPMPVAFAPCYPALSSYERAPATPMMRGAPGDYMSQVEADIEKVQLEQERFIASMNEDLLAAGVERVRELDASGKAARQEIEQLRDGHRDTMEKLKTLRRCQQDRAHLAQAKEALSKVGGKCERLFKADAGIHDMCHAAAGHIRRVTKLLAGTRDHYEDSARTFSAAKSHLKHREREAVQSSKEAAAELAKLKKRMECRDREVASELAGYQVRTKALGQELRDAMEQLDGVVAKNHQLERKYQRSKGNAQTFYDQEKKTLCERDAALAERDAALAERDAALAERPMCAICFDRDVRLVVNLPCGHACECENCSDITRPCAICSDGVSIALPLYFCF